MVGCGKLKLGKTDLKAEESLIALLFFLFLQITMCTIGYGDAVPVTWQGKVIGAIVTLLSYSFFALPAVSLKELLLF